MTHPFIEAWGKFLGFTASTISTQLQEAQADSAPREAIQKIDGRWLTLDDIQNATNRQRVIELAKR